MRTVIALCFWTDYTSFYLIYFLILEYPTTQTQTFYTSGLKFLAFYFNLILFKGGCFAAPEKPFRRIFNQYPLAF